jgi:hypothetical protein
MPLYLYQLRRSVGVPIGAFATAVARPICAAALMVLSVRWLMSMAPAGEDSALWLIAAVALGALAYPLLLGCFWLLAGKPQGPERIVLDRVRAAWARRKASVGNLPARSGTK